ncbi:tubulin binding cofactor C-domain-containing protein, partial [Gloeopeniophorella convolvens]
LKDSSASENAQQELMLDVRKLRKSLTDATSLLPSYDQRQCQSQMAALEQALEEMRAASAPKAKFSFKRKATKPVSSPAPATSYPPLPAAQSREESALPAVSTFHNLGPRSHVRLSLQDISTLARADSPSSDLTISSLDRCIVDLCSAIPEAEPASYQDPLSLTALHMRDLKNTILILPNLKGSVLLYNLHNCTIIVGCHQARLPFRMHNATNVHVYLGISSNPVVEHCSAITFAGYPASISSLHPTVAAGLPSNHADVQDFSHIRATASPNWTASTSEDEDWDDLFTPESSSPQGLDAILIAHLPLGSTTV